MEYKTDKIFHVADIHIRNYKRHSEYRAVFKKMLKYIKSVKTKNSVIYLAGDIVHQKTDMTPELIELTSWLFKSCADLLPTIVITGNHDTNLNNNSRLDALSPIINALDHDNIYYWKDTGVYKIHPEDNVSYSVFSVFGSPEDWIPAKDIKNNDIKIAFHHGAVTGATTELNYQITNDHVKSSIFRGYDYALLGDIHKFQYLDEKKRICYASSLIQQNYGESVDNHGLVVWDLENETHEFVPIKNDIAYATLSFKQNQLMTPKSYIEQLPKYLRLRIKHEATDKEVIESYVKTLKQKHVFKEYIAIRSNALDYNISNADMTIGDVRDIEYQNTLIEQYLKQIDLPSEKVVDQIRHMNRMANSEVNSNKKVVRNVIWKPIQLEFSNMFSYGPNNKFNLELHGLQGLFAPNAAGKSTLLDALTYCLFDKCSRTWKASEVLNIHKTLFKSKFVFQMAGEEYVVVRNGKADKHGHVRVEVDFYRQENGKKVESLKGKDRDTTNKHIREYIGTYDDFLLTALSTQNDNRNFVFKTQRERKDLLYSFLDISLFTQLWNYGKIKLKEKKAVIKASTESINQVNESEYYEQQRALQALITQYKGTVDHYKIQQTELATEISNLIESKQRIPVMRPLSIIEGDIESNNLNLKKIIASANQLKNEMQTAKDQYEEAKNNISEENFNSIELEYELKKFKLELTELNNKINKRENLLINARTKEKLLESYEYDPECKYCVDNEIVKTANREVGQISFYIKALEEDKLFRKTLNIKVQELQLIYNRYLKSQEIENNIVRYKLVIDGILQKIEVQKLKFNECHSKLKDLASEKDSLEEYKTILLENNNIDEKVKNLKALGRDVIKSLDSTLVLLKDSETSLIVVTNNIEQLNLRKESLNKLIAEYEVYQLYVKTISPKGIPYMLLTKILPVLESEVNKLLLDIVDFNVELKTDEKHNILCYINYNDGKSWPIELASGMEKFITSLAIRSSLVEVTSLPRPNFIAIDEGFGVLDADNVNNIYLLFNKIKTKFDFILCITHLNTLKDLADSKIEISRKGKDFSYVNNIQ